MSDSEENSEQQHKEKESDEDGDEDYDEEDKEKESDEDGDEDYDVEAMPGQELAQEAENGNLQRVKDLLAQGVSADSKGSDGFPALVNAGVKDHTAVAEALLTARANVHVTDPDGNTALHWAGRWGNTATAQALLAAGAHIEAKDNDGQTSLDLARKNYKPVTAKLLEEVAKMTPEQRSDKAEWKKIEAAVKKAEEDAMSGQELAQEAWNGNLQRVKDLLAQGVSADSEDSDGFPALVNAGVKGHTAVAEALLTARANVHVTDPAGQAALDLARKNYKPVTAKLLEEVAKVAAACAALT
eukprot:g72664.t1